MKQQDIDTQLNTQEGKGLAIIEEDIKIGKGKWCSLWVTPKESTGIYLLKMKWAAMGIKLPFSQILRALANRGLDSIDWEELKTNPSILFREVIANES